MGPTQSPNDPEITPAGTAINSSSDSLMSDSADSSRMEPSSMFRPAVSFAAKGLCPGTVIDGRFAVIERLGGGGMGEVFRVADLYRNGTARALKVIRSEYSGSQEFAGRFRVEIGLILSFMHQNICRAYDLGIDQICVPPRLYYTMELIEGETLASYLQDRGPMPPEDVEELALGLIAGLETAHTANVYHRDLKPGNIMLRRGDLRVDPVILDFGLAVDATAGAVTSNPEGTVQYMAPEQIRGGAITARADIFALGLVLCEALTSNRLAYGEEFIEPLKSAIAQHNSRANRGKLIPSFWIKILSHCLHVQPERRYTSVSHIRAEILWHRKMPRRIALSLTALGGTAVAAALWPRAVAGSKPRNSEAAAAYERGTLHSRRLVADELRKAVEYYHRATVFDPEFALAWAGLSDAYSRLSDYGGLPGREAFDKAQAAARTAIRTGPGLAEAHAALGLALSIDPRNWTQAEASFRRARELNPNYSSTYQWYGAHLARVGRTKEAVDFVALAVAADPLSLPVSVVLGWMYYLDRQFDKAIERGINTVDLDPNFLYGHILLARTFLAVNRLPDAARACETASRISLSLSKRGTVAPVVQSVLTGVLARQGQSERAREMAEGLEKERHTEPIPIHYVAAAYCELGNHRKAIACMRTGFDECDTGVLYLRVYPPFDPIRHLPEYAQLIQKIGLPAHNNG